MNDKDAPSDGAPYDARTTEMPIQPAHDRPTVNVPGDPHSDYRRQAAAHFAVTDPASSTTKQTEGAANRQTEQFRTAAANLAGGTPGRTTGPTEQFTVQAPMSTSHHGAAAPEQQIPSPGYQRPEWSGRNQAWAQWSDVPPTAAPLPPPQANSWSPPQANSWAPPPALSPQSHHNRVEQLLPLVDRLIDRGARGELIRAPWFQNIRLRNADAFVIGTYAVGFFLTVLLESFTSSVLTAFVVYALWLGLGYLYLALGTRLSHQFLKYGICLVAVVVLLLTFLSTMSAVLVGRSLANFAGMYAATMAPLVFRLFVGILTAPVFVLVGLRVHRFSSGERPPETFTVGPSYGPAGRQSVPPADNFAGQYPLSAGEYSPHLSSPPLAQPPASAPPGNPEFSPPPAQHFGPYVAYGPRPTNSMAIVALVTSLLLAPLGIIFGHISLSQIKRSGEDGRGLAIAGLVIGYLGTALAAVGIAIVVAGVAAFNSALHSIDSELSTTPTTYETPVGTPSSTAQAIKNADVGDCIHKVNGARRSDGSRDVTVSPATCGSSYATHRVTDRTDDTSDCYNDWVRTQEYSPQIVLCLVTD